MRKLKRKSTNTIDNEAHKTAAIVKGRKLRKRYKKQKCAFVYADQSKCLGKAVGKSTLCKKHGGDPVVIDNLISTITDGIITDKMALVTSKFKPAYHPLAYINFSREGKSEVEIAAQFKVGVNTMRGWSEKYLEFSTAFEIGNALHEAWWLEKGKTNLNDRTFNTRLFKFLTSNKLGYSDKMETKNLNTNIHGVLVIPSKQTETEWAETNAEDDIVEVEVVDD